MIPFLAGNVRIGSKDDNAYVLVSSRPLTVIVTIIPSLLVGICLRIRRANGDKPRDLAVCAGHASERKSAYIIQL